MFSEKFENGHIRMYSIKESAEWNTVVRSFENWDVYYLSEYAYSLMVHGDGEPFLIEYEDEKAHFCYVVMKKDIADSTGFEGELEKGRYFDLETPYGYGGPLSDNEIPETSQRRFYNKFSEYCHDEHIVSQFVRFHPLLGNQDRIPLVIESRYMHDTIFIDTADSESIMSKMESTCRNKIRKAMKMGVTIERVPITEYEGFIPFYTETMHKKDANDYYFFQEEYFKSLVQLKDNASIFYAMYDRKPIGGSIIFYNKQFMHYHLSGAYTEYKSLPSINLILYESAFWAADHGILKFHLGGGITQEDRLFEFKKQFNRNGRSHYYIGRTIFDQDDYNKLLAFRKSLDPDFNMENDHMIQYRQ